jgi:hypothetical protein
MAEHLNSCLTLLLRGHTTWQVKVGSLNTRLVAGDHRFRGPAMVAVQLSGCFRQVRAHCAAADEDEVGLPSWRSPRWRVWRNHRGKPPKARWPLAPPQRTSLSPRQEEPLCSRRRFVIPAVTKIWGIGDWDVSLGHLSFERSIHNPHKYCKRDREPP